MKRYIRFFLFALFAASLAFPQVVKVKRVAVSPADQKLKPWAGYVSTGLKVVGKNSTVYFAADTTGSGATVVTSFAWSILAQPAGSVAAFDTTNRMDAHFKPDVVGQYVVQISVNGGAKTAVDTILASTYKGSLATGLTCGTCHPTTSADYSLTKHSSIYKRGLTGMLENDAANGYKGAYGTSCAKCHTTGWDNTADNGNFGFTAKATGWDTTWYKPDVLVGNEIFIPYEDQTRWNLLGTAPYATVKPTATIGCESCHGAGVEHAIAGNKAKIAKSFNAGICLQCHDSPTKHSIGLAWKESLHATMPLSGSQVGRSACYPCHSGSALIKYVNNPTNPGYDQTVDNIASISCITCHDPHSANHEYQLRIVEADSLKNGYKPPLGTGGKGALCMTCHKVRVNSKTTVNGYMAVYGVAGKSYPSRIYPHYSPQADMFLGQNSYDFDVATLKGVMTHEGVEDACVTCHMSTRINGSGIAPNHAMSMVDKNGQDVVTACKSCHGNITSFDDIKAGSDYDGDGTVESTIHEIDGLLVILADLLPKDNTGAVVELANTATRVADSTAIATSQYGERVFPGIWNYYYVAHDWSHGVHNARYAVQLLNYTIQYVKTGVVPVELTSFTGSLNNGIVSLQWQTASEKNNRGFDVQRKIGTKWETIGFVNGRGTSTNVNRYSYSDNLSKLTVAGNISYRLRQVDFDGTTTFTQEVNVSYTSAPKSFSLSQNYPNPFNPSTTIRYALPFDSNVKISIYKVTGELVKVLVSGTKTAGNYEVTMNTAHENVEFSSGIYFYSIEANAVDGSNSFKQTKKMILLK
ncbi:MAG: T9SS type A sorting domain-containing protein [Ignavibacteriaceae bacterium]|nr:T9SS type A sorting domain-containing protein [Ignavibacteriaceae bacterium]